MSEFIIQLEKLFHAVTDAEYRFLLIEPLMFYGLITGVILLITGLCLKASRLLSAALITIVVAALLHSPYNEARQAAQPRMEQVYKIQFGNRMEAFNRNTKDWLTKNWQFKLLILAAGATFLIGANRNRYGMGGAILTALLALMAAKNAMWLHYQDSIAYHPNLKVHDAPIHRNRAMVTVPQPNHRTTTGNREATRTAPQASSQSLAPAAKATPSQAPVSQERISPPPTPSSGPRLRDVKPLSH